MFFLRKLGFKTDDTKEKVIESLERMPKDMLADFQEEELASFIFSHTIKVLYDWFDMNFIHYLNSDLEQLGIQKRFILFGDPNGCMLTYKNPDFTEKLRAMFPMFEADVM